MLETEDLLPLIRRLHVLLRDRVLAATRERTVGELSAVVAEQGGDLVFALDEVAEQTLTEFVANEIACHEPIVLVAEGLPDGKLVLPRTAAEESCRWRMIVDPIDGTRPLMYQKRSGWVLTGVAPNRGNETDLRDIVLAVQTEIPLVKQHLSDQAWAVRGEGAAAVRHDILSGEPRELNIEPSAAKTARMGFATVSRFFPSVTDVLGDISDELVRRALGPLPPGGTLCFEDQYPSTGGQLHGLFSGADRFVADLRPLLRAIADDRGEAMAHCCHPYDVCTALIAEELGVVITSPTGEELRAPLDCETDVPWVGYANDAIRRELEPVLHNILQERNLI